MAQWESTRPSDDRETAGNVTRRRFMGVVAGEAAAFGLASSVLAGCFGGDDDGSSSGGGSGGKPQRGGTLRVGLSGGFTTDVLSPLNPTSSPDYLRYPNLWDPLVGYSVKGRPELVLAEEVEPNADATEWTIRMKKGITFHNGKEATSKDLKYLFVRSVDPKAPSNGATHLATMNADGIREVDKYTIRIPFDRPYSTLLDTLADYFFYVIPVGFNTKNPIGTGPFKYESFTPGQESRFVRNENYWETGKPYVDTLVITNFPDEASQVNALVSGQTDMVDLLSPTSIDSVKSSGGKVLRGRPGGWNPFAMRTDKAPFDDVRVREAFKLIPDRQQMLDQVFSGEGKIANDLPSFYDAVYDHEIPQREQDLEKAKSLLKAAGHEGLTVELITSDIAQGTVQQAQVFAQQAKGAGVDVKLRKVSTTELFGPNYLKWTFTQSYWTYNPFFPYVALADLPSSVYNETHYGNPRYRQLYEQALSTIDVAKRKELAGEMQQLYYDEGGYIIPNFAPVIDAHAANVNGAVEGSTGYSFHQGRFKDVWLS